MKTGSGTQTLSGTIGYTGTTTINGGSLNINTAMGSGGAVTVNAGADLNASANINRPISGVGSTSVLSVMANNISLGDSTNALGFDFQGVFSVTTFAVTLNSAGFAALTGNTIINGGSITAPNGVSLGSGASLNATGTVTATVNAAEGSIINAVGGNLTLGDATKYSAFVTAGQVNTSTYTITLNSLNQVTLGSVTTIGAGSNAGAIAAANGIYIDFAKAVTGTGSITVGSTVATSLINNGTVAGTSTSNMLTINGYAKGDGAYNNVIFNGTYSPGLSPALVNVGNIGFSSSNKLVMEIGGTSQGSQYDAIVSSGNIAFNGTLSLQLINGFTPAAGESFNLFAWSTESGAFTSYDLPDLSASGLTWDLSNLYTTGVVAVVPSPEPSFALGLAALAIAGMASLRRRCGSAAPLAEV